MERLYQRLFYWPLVKGGNIWYLPHHGRYPSDELDILSVSVAAGPTNNLVDSLQLGATSSARNIFMPMFDEFTMAAWFMASSIPASGFRSLFWRGGPSDTDGIVLALNPSAQLQLFAWDTSGNQIHDLVSQPISAGTWYFVALMFEPLKRARIWLSGTEYTQTPSPNNQPRITHRFGFSFAHTLGFNSWEGNVGHYCVWFDRILETSLIRRLWNNNLGVDLRRGI